MRGFYEFPTKAQAETRHAQIKKLGWSVFTIFQTARGTWAFHVN